MPMVAERPVVSAAKHTKNHYRIMVTIDNGEKVTKKVLAADSADAIGMVLKEISVEHGQKLKIDCKPD